MTLETEPRVHPKLLEALKKHGVLDQPFLSPEVKHDSPISAVAEFVSKGERAIEGFLNSFNYKVLDPGSLTCPIARAEEFIPSPDGHLIRLIIRRPTGYSDGQLLPAIVYFHSGGMVILDTENAMHASWAETLARTGLVVISVDFRNARASSGAFHPFPAGLDDCVEAVRWINAHRAQLGISKIVLEGESGGANLALATTLRARREGWSSVIDGVYASSPYISGAYHLDRDWKLSELPSLVECDSYTVSVSLAALTARMYDPDGKNARNPLAWPYWASEEDLRGLPTHFIVTNELDPYRDEGNAYLRKLGRAGVRVSGRMNMGIVHEAELAFRDVLPDLFLANLWECRKFVDMI